MTQDKKRLGLAVNKPLYDKITSLAEYHGKTINSQCVDMFWFYFENKQNTLVGNSQEKTAPKEL